MKKGLIFCFLFTTIANAAEMIDMQREEDSVSGITVTTFVYVRVAENVHMFESFPSLQKLCIYVILTNPREYIKQDAEHILSNDVQNTIRQKWYKHEVRRKLIKEKEQFKIKDPYTDYSYNGLLSKRIPLAQLLLLEACNQAENEEEKLALTQQEKEIFNGMLPMQQEEIKPHIKKSFWTEIYEIVCT